MSSYRRDDFKEYRWDINFQASTFCHVSHLKSDFNYFLNVLKRNENCLSLPNARSYEREYFTLTKRI